MDIFKNKDAETKAAKPAAKAAKTAKPKEDKKASMKDLYEGKEATTKKKDAKPMAKRGQAHRILLRPLITEKAAAESTGGKYFFEVAISANKIEVADAVCEVYGIKPTDINIVRMKGKAVRYGRMMGQRKDWKKAIVTLPKGESINIYEGV